MDKCLVVLDKNITTEMATAIIRDTKPTEIIAVARHAESSWLAVKQLGLRIPQDISFIAYDDINWMNMLGITAVSHPLAKIARSVSERLIVLMDKRDNREPEGVVLKSELKHRESVGDLKII